MENKKNSFFFSLFYLNDPLDQQRILYVWGEEQKRAKLEKSEWNDDSESKYKKKLHRIAHTNIRENPKKYQMW